MVDILKMNLDFVFSIPYLDDHKDDNGSSDLTQESVKTIKDEANDKVHLWLFFSRNFGY